MEKAKADYGLDAPGLVRGFLAGGLALTALGAATEIGFLGPEYIDWSTSLLSPGISFALSGALMAFYSYFGKMKSRDHLIRSLALSGKETVLDLGCGRGLLLIGAAKAVPTGKAIGLDLWSNRDLSANSKDATLRNATLEGVSDRVEVLDGDMREIPLANGSVDVIIASMSIHNIPTKEGRQKAIADAARVLRPGGKVALLDFKATGTYLATLKELGFTNLKRPYSPFCFPPARIVYGEKPL